jgi:RNA polymerase sigma factor (sigma-70 family)
MEMAYLSHGQSLYRLASSLTGEVAAAEDLFHDAFVRVFSRPRQIPDDEIEYYLRRTIVNLARTRWRRQRIESKLKGGAVASRINADGLVPDSVWESILRLPIRQRAAVIMHHYEDRSENEVGASLGCSASAARSLIHRGMTAIRRELKGHHDE